MQAAIAKERAGEAAAAAAKKAASTGGAPGPPGRAATGGVTTAIGSVSTNTRRPPAPPAGPAVPLDAFELAAAEEGGALLPGGGSEEDGDSDGDDTTGYLKAHPTRGGTGRYGAYPVTGEKMSRAQAAAAAEEAALRGEAEAAAAAARAEADKKAGKKPRRDLPAAARVRFCAAPPPALPARADAAAAAPPVEQVTTLCFYEGDEVRDLKGKAGAWARTDTANRADNLARLAAGEVPDPYCKRARAWHERVVEGRGGTRGASYRAAEVRGEASADLAAILASAAQAAARWPSPGGPPRWALAPIAERGNHAAVPGSESLAAEIQGARIEAVARCGAPWFGRVVGGPDGADNSLLPGSRPPPPTPMEPEKVGDQGGGGAAAAPARCVWGDKPPLVGRPPPPCAAAPASAQHYPPPHDHHHHHPAPFHGIQPRSTVMAAPAPPDPAGPPPLPRPLPGNSGGMLGTWGRHQGPVPPLAPWAPAPVDHRRQQGGDDHGGRPTRRIVQSLPPLPPPGAISKVPTAAAAGLGGTRDRPLFRGVCKFYGDAHKGCERGEACGFVHRGVGFFVHRSDGHRVLERVVTEEGTEGGGGGRDGGPPSPPPPRGGGYRHHGGYDAWRPHPRRGGGGEGTG